MMRSAATQTVPKVSGAAVLEAGDEQVEVPAAAGIAQGVEGALGHGAFYRRLGRRP
jgi:hypothetical protein